MSELPPIERVLDDDLTWLAGQPTVEEWALCNVAEQSRVEERASEIRQTPGLHLPRSFEAFISSPGPGRRIRSGTGCYIDFADFITPVDDGGQLVHFLCDQQWVAHWLLYVGTDGSEAVVETYTPYGFDVATEELEPGLRSVNLKSFDIASADAVVCSESFSEFIYRYWIENELSIRQDLADAPEEMKRYVEHYRRTATS
jgi:hypothetical protein